MYYKLVAYIYLGNILYVKPAEELPSVEPLPLGLGQFETPRGPIVQPFDMDFSSTEQVYHIWPGNLHESIAMSCWLIKRHGDTHSERYRRQWYVGEGSFHQLRPVHRFDYQVDENTEALILQPSKALMNEHSVFSCLLAVKSEKAVGHLETHRLIFHPPILSSSADCFYQMKIQVHVCLPNILDWAKVDECQMIPLFSPLWKNEKNEDFYKVRTEVLKDKIKQILLEYLSDMGGTSVQSLELFLTDDEQYLFDLEFNTTLWQNTLWLNFNTGSEELPFNERIATDQLHPIWNQLAVTEYDVLGKVKRNRPVIVRFLNIQKETHPNLGIPEESHQSNHTTEMLTRPTTVIVEPISATKKLVLLPTAASWQPEEDFGKAPVLKDILDRLKPDESYLEAQQDALELVADLVYLGFTDNEVSLMLFISMLLGLLGFALMAVLFYGLSQPSTWMQIQQRARQPSVIHREVVSATVVTCGVLKTIVFLPLVIVLLLVRRITNQAVEAGQRIRDSETGQMIRDTVNVFRREQLIEQFRDLVRERRLLEILTRLTVNRIVETADLARELERQTRPTQPSPLTVTIKVKSNTPRVLEPYMQLARRHDAAFFFLHPEYVERLYGFRTMYPAPFYPLDIGEPRSTLVLY
ncbi:hypothetical protein CRM22_001724 [Opisthorchis felineus]|uniref:Uncharacterized protein n=1 Tax=Opisthorchis felineus TaxID=147828 RepID=A0A4S2MDN6_OPIFE|nr:hypothetical protein CRM22_001724 [Opisthorchis felineus]